MSRDMPIGLCCVCDEPLDLSEAGVCKTCGQGFCWDDCGGWEMMEHTCRNCSQERDEDEATPPDGAKGER